MKKINLLGINLTDYTLREALKLSNIYLYNGALNTISYISTQILVEAGENEQQREWIESMDMTICGEIDILKAAHMDTRNRVREVENDEFLREFIHKLSRNKRKVFLIAENEQELEKLTNYLGTFSYDLHIKGTFCTGLEGTNEILVNEINDVVPNVIISRLPYPKQEQLMSETKKLINADIWLALLEHANIHRHKTNHLRKLYNHMYRTIFRRKVNKYQKES